MSSLRHHHQLALAALFVSLAGCSPYADKEIIRHTEPVTIVGRYMAYACGDFCPQIRPESGFHRSVDLSWLDTGLMFRVPDEFSAPDQYSDLCVPHNLFELTGYFYFVQHEGTRFLHPRFDLIAWRPLLPYSVWRPHSSSEPLSHIPVEISEYGTYPDGWRRAQGNPAAAEDFDFARKYN